MNIGIALVPAIEKEVTEMEKICGAEGIRKAIPLNRDDMVQMLVTAEALNQMASHQERTVNSWKDVESNTQMKRARIRSLLHHWKATLRTIDELRKESSERTVRYVIAHQMQAKASVVPDGKVVLDIGANIYVDFTYDEAQDRLEKAIEVGNHCAARLLTCFEECKRNIVTSEVNVSQLHNYSVEIRETLLNSAS